MAGRKVKRRKRKPGGRPEDLRMACEVCASEYVMRKPVKAKYILTIGEKGHVAFCRRCAEVLEFLYRDRDRLLAAMDEVNVEGPDAVSLLGLCRSEHGFRFENGNVFWVDAKGEHVPDPEPKRPKVKCPRHDDRGQGRKCLLDGEAAVGGGDDEHSTSRKK